MSSAIRDETGYAAGGMFAVGRTWRADGLTVTLDRSDGHRRLRLRGVLDASTAALAVAVVEHEHRSGNTEVWLDLGEITRAEPEVLAELGKQHRRLREHGVRLLVTGLNRHALRSVR